MKSNFNLETAIPWGMLSTGEVKFETATQLEIQSPTKLLGEVS